MKQLISSLICMLFLASVLTADEQPFGVSASLTQAPTSEKVLSVVVTVPDGHFLYADQFRVAVPEPIRLIPKTTPVPEKKKDAFSGRETEVFANDFAVAYWVRNLSTNTLPV
ncbi:protein-disulfide reductase DsbD domain-containing protein, partial [Verrucomicrobiota bacterium]